MGEAADQVKTSNKHMMNVLTLVQKVINTRVAVPDDFISSLQTTGDLTTTVNATRRDMHELVEILKEHLGNTDSTTAPTSAAAGVRILPTVRRRS